MKELKLSKKVKASIKAWLELVDHEKELVCPFGTTVGVYQTHKDVAQGKAKDFPCREVCAKIFPSLLTPSGETPNCPCHKLTLGYVIRRAKELTR